VRILGGRRILEADESVRMRMRAKVVKEPSTTMAVWGAGLVLGMFNDRT
jgi:hypothetical protein